MPNFIYVNEGTDIVFAPAAAADSDIVFEVDGLGATSGHRSARKDFGITARERRFTWRAFVQFATAPVVGTDLIKIYLLTDDTTSHPDMDDGTGDGAVSSIDKLLNLRFLGVITADEAAINIQMVGSGDIEISQRYVQVVFWNPTTKALTTDVDENGFILTPVASEIQ